MTAQECLKYIVKELHTVVFSTVDEKRLSRHLRH